MSPAIPAVGYVRMSSSKQDASPEQQRAEIQKLAKRDGYKIVRWYADEAVSGDDTKRRVEFRRMIADAESKGDFRTILCWDVSRFGRFDSIEAGRWIFPLREAGVSLVTVCEGLQDWHSMGGRIVASVAYEQKNEFLQSLSRSSLRGRISAAMKGWIGSAPYGYDKELRDPSGKLMQRVHWSEELQVPKGWSQKLVPSADTESVETVRWIFTEYATKDVGFRHIAKTLNARGIKSRYGRLWSVQIVIRTLTSKVYIGTREFGKRRRGRHSQVTAAGDVGAAKNGPADPMTCAEDAHEPLIERELFDRVQQKITERVRTNRKPRQSNYLLSGILRCGHCGRPMAGSAQRTHRLYRCSGSLTHGTCDNYTIRADVIEPAVIDVIAARLTDEDIAAVEAEVRDRLATKAKKGDTSAIRSKLAQIATKIDRANENFLEADKDDLPALRSKIAAWKAERDRLKAELKACDRSAIELDVSKIVAPLRELQTVLKGGNPAQNRQLVREVVSDVRIWWGRVGRYRHIEKGSATLVGEELAKVSRDIIVSPPP